MTTYQANSARNTRAASTSPAMRLLMSEVHRLLGEIILDPSDNAKYERLDEIAYVIWEWCVTHGTQPWGWCLDRYCSCKLVLAEHEPDPLPGMGARPRAGRRSERA